MGLVKHGEGSILPEADQKVAVKTTEEDREALRQENQDVDSGSEDGTHTAH